MRLELDVPARVLIALDGLASATGFPRPACFRAAVALTLARYGPDDTIRFSTVNGSSATPGVVELAWHPATTVRDVLERVVNAPTIAAGPPRPGGGRDFLSGGSGRMVAAVLDRAEALSGHEDVLIRGDADALLALCAGTGLAVRVCRGVMPLRPMLGFAGHVLATLAAMRDALDRPPGSCPMLGAAERAALLASARGPRADYPLDDGLKRRFEQVAATNARAVAVTGEDEDGARVTIGYDELNRWADAVAAALLRSGAGPGTPVVVCVPRSAAAVAALLGTVKTGATYVPADAGHPPAYLGRIVGEVAPAVVVTDDRTARRIGGHVGRATLLTVPAAGDHLENLPDPAEPGLLIFHTSGSTGRPKAVTHRQHQVLNRLHWMWEAYPFGEREVMCQRSPLGVMPAMWELLGGLLHGVPTAIAPDSVTRDPALLARFVAEHAVTRMTLPPSAFAALAAVPGSRSLLATLRYVTIGGELPPPGFVEAFRDAVPAATMIEDYGCTETNTILHRALRPGDTELPGGRPIANLTAYVLDRYGEPAPPGATGELAVAGVPLAVACSGDQERHAHRFVPNELDPVGGPVMYRTGDLARVHHDGSVTLVGRADHQLKVQGRRVEPAEVEGVLMTHPAVAACGVTAPGPELVVLAVAAPGRDLATADLVAFAADRLPPFMVPTRLLLVPELPRLPNGKLDRRAMARLAIRPDTAPSHVAGAGLATRLRAVLAQLLGRELDESTDTTEFRRHGLSSLLIVEYAKRLSEQLGLEVTPATLYEHFTIEDLADQLAGRCGSAPTPSPNPVAGATPDDASGIAIIGIACRFPDADSPERFWSLLAGGHCAVKPIPPERIDPGPLGAGWSAALLDEVAWFDPAFFGISPADAAVLDPQIRIGLEESWRAFEDAGYAPAALSAGQTGVFVGMRRGDLGSLLDRAGMPPSTAGLLGTSPAMLGARIAAHLDLSGPAVTVDTACSSSLTAVHLAARALADGECDLALAGGVHIVLSRDFLQATRGLGILSPSGRCRAFDRDADGTVQGEGAGFVVLKRMDDALRDGDDIRAVIIGSGLGANGRANGLGAPNPRSQAALQQRVHRRFGIDPATIGYVEAHGTGTAIGDPLEVEALCRAFGAGVATRPRCGIGSVKTNIGHLNEAAGIAGLIKATLCLGHRQLPPTLGVETPCAGLAAPGSPFYLVSTLEQWRSETPRRAAINSFGLSGTNVHCVLEEAPPRRAPLRSRPPACLFLISAGTATSLAALTDRFRRWIVGAGRDHDLLDISFTLLTGRARHRVSTWAVAATHDELAGALTGVATAAADPDPLGRAGRLVSDLAGGYLDGAGYRQALTELGVLLASTPSLEVTGLFSPWQVRRVPVPTYRFDRQRCWPALLGPTDPAPAALAGSPRPVLLRAFEAALGLTAGSLSSSADLSDFACDSIEATGLKSRLEEALDVEVPIRLLIHEPSLTAVLERVEEHVLAAGRAGEQ